MHVKQPLAAFKTSHTSIKITGIKWLKYWPRVKWSKWCGDEYSYEKMIVLYYINYNSSNQKLSLQNIIEDQQMKQTCSGRKRQGQGTVNCSQIFTSLGFQTFCGNPASFFASSIVLRLQSWLCRLASLLMASLFLSAVSAMCWWQTAQCLPSWVVLQKQSVWTIFVIFFLWVLRSLFLVLEKEKLEEEISCGFDQLQCYQVQMLLQLEFLLIELYFIIINASRKLFNLRVKNKGRTLLQGTSLPSSILMDLCWPTFAKK